MYSLSGTHLLCRCLFNKSPSLPTSPSPPSAHTNHICFFFYWNTGAAMTHLQEEPLVCRDQGSEFHGMRIYPVSPKLWYIHLNCCVTCQMYLQQQQQKAFFVPLCQKVISKFTYVSFSSRDFKQISLINSISLQRFPALQVIDVHLILLQIPFSVRITLVSAPESACSSWI